jgi:hypothetical protein
MENYVRSEFVCGVETFVLLQVLNHVDPGRLETVDGEIRRQQYSIWKENINNVHVRDVNFVSVAVGFATRLPSFTRFFLKSSAPAPPLVLENAFVLGIGSVIYPVRRYTFELSSYPNFALLRIFLFRRQSFVTR